MAEVGIGIRSKRSPHTLSITTYFCHSFHRIKSSTRCCTFAIHRLTTIFQSVTTYIIVTMTFGCQLNTTPIAYQLKSRIFLTDCSEHWAYRNGRANHSKHAELFFIPTIILYTSFSISQQNLSIANDRIILHTLPTLIRSKRNQLTVIISGPRFISI